MEKHMPNGFRTSAAAPTCRRRRVLLCVYGWASWFIGDAVLLLYYSGDMGIEGWARLPGVAPVNGPESWLKLAQAIVAAIREDYSYLPGMSGQQFH